MLRWNWFNPIIERVAVQLSGRILGFTHALNIGDHLNCLLIKSYRITNGKDSFADNSLRLNNKAKWLLQTLVQQSRLIIQKSKWDFPGKTSLGARFFLLQHVEIPVIFGSFMQQFRLLICRWQEWEKSTETAKSETLQSPWIHLICEGLFNFSFELTFLLIIKPMK